MNNVGTDDVATVGIDENDDAEGTPVEKNVSDDLSAASASNNGETVTFVFGGSYSLDAGDEVVVFENVQNADAGEYEVRLAINPQSSGGSGTATLTREDTESTDASAPGFGVALTVLALFGAAFVATRQLARTAIRARCDRRSAVFLSLVDRTAASRRNALPRSRAVNSTPTKPRVWHAGACCSHLVTDRN